MGEMLTADEFYEQRKLFSQEMDLIKSRIWEELLDLDYDSSDGSITIPLGSVTRATEIYLDKYGWVFRNGYLLAKTE